MKPKLEEVMLNWRTLTDGLSTCSEEEVLEMLTAERERAKRASILERLHQRYSTMRMYRERTEILNGARHV